MTLRSWPEPKSRVGHLMTEPLRCSVLRIFKRPIHLIFTIFQWSRYKYKNIHHTDKEPKTQKTEKLLPNHKGDKRQNGDLNWGCLAAKFTLSHYVLLLLNSCPGYLIHLKILKGLQGAPHSLKNLSDTDVPGICHVLSTGL